MPPRGKLSLDTFDEEDQAPVAELPPQALDATVFATAYESLLNELEGPAAVLHATLKAKRYRLAGHRWIYTAVNQLEVTRFEQEREFLVGRLRHLTGNPTLVLEVELDETLAPVLRQHVRTREDVIAELIQKNPHLATLMQKFQTVVV